MRSPREPALLRRRSATSFETDSPPIFCRLLKAQGWTFLSFGGLGPGKSTHLLAEHLGYGEVRCYDSGLVMAKGDEVLTFLASLVEWCGGRDE